MHRPAPSDSVHQQFAYGLRFVTVMVYEGQLLEALVKARR